MKNIKNVAPKPKTKKVATKAKKNKVQMVSYSIEMTIPTGAYANIKPSIIVKGGSIQEAHDYIAPHMNKLWKEYFMINERRPEPVKVKESPLTGTATPGHLGVPGVVATNVVAPPYSVPMTTEEIATATGGKVIGDKVPNNVPSNIPGPDSSVAFNKATQAIDSCLSLEALELIEAQVIKSVKLSHEDKEALMPKLHDKAVELTFPEDEKTGN